jgi:catechol 2,3-dioxygenase-like lactoylglutathione lyase family enzyme
MVFVAKSPRSHAYHGQKLGFLVILLVEFAVRKFNSVLSFTSSPPASIFDYNSRQLKKRKLHPLFASPDTPALSIHHSALKTRNITTAIEFYSLFGYQVACRFRAGPARAAWLEFTSTSLTRLELIEVPAYILQEEPGTRARAMDLMQRPEFLGYNHVAIDATEQILHAKFTSLNEWLDQLNRTSIDRFQRSLRMAVAPRQQIIGRGVYELAFLYDADGCLIEVLHKQSELSQEIQSGWDPWDGKGFAGRQ